MQQDVDGNSTYQGVNITACDNGFAAVAAVQSSLSEKVVKCISSRISSQDSDLLSDALAVSATYGWEKSDDICGLESVARLKTMFHDPLVAAGVDILLIEGSGETWSSMLAAT